MPGYPRKSLLPSQSSAVARETHIQNRQLRPAMQSNRHLPSMKGFSVTALETRLRTPRLNQSERPNVGHRDVSIRLCDAST